jgi:hypothetical protein
MKDEDLQDEDENDTPIFEPYGDDVNGDEPTAP